MNRLYVFLFIFFIVFMKISAQNPKKLPKYFGETFNIESTNKLLITVQYNADQYSGKFSLSYYYGNIIFYDYIKNTQSKLFKEHTLIKSFRAGRYYGYDINSQDNLPKNITSKYIFLFVRNTDYDKNNKITDSDPAILYVCDLNGDNLQALTPDDENAISFELFEEHGFFLVRMQRDYNNDKDFTSRDKDYYYLNIDLKTLTINSKIEMNMTE